MWLFAAQYNSIYGKRLRVIRLIAFTKLFCYERELTTLNIGLSVAKNRKSVAKSAHMKVTATIL